MSIALICVMIALQFGAGCSAVADGQKAVAVLMGAGILANASALMMAWGMR